MKTAGRYLDIPLRDHIIIGGDGAFYSFNENEAEYKQYLIPVSNSEDNNDDCKPGDVNGDGKITSSDYVLIKDYIMGNSELSDTAKKAADYNQDGKITSSDYVLIKDYIMGE